MNLKIGKSNGREYLSIAHGYRDPKSKITKTKTIKSLGYLDNLKKQYDDPIAHFREVVKKMNEDELAQKELCKIEIDPNTKLTGGGQKNLGYAALSQIYHTLGLDLLFRNRARDTKAEYSVNDIMKTEVYARILFPGSKKCTYENRVLFFEKNNYSLEDVYRCLSFVNSLKDVIVQHLHLKITEKYGRATELTYYDVTNYYFEIDEQDELRRKGVSKEHRPDPIVQMGLLQDNKGIPITFELFAGNTNDCETLLSVLCGIKSKFNIAKTIVVADKGLSTHQNIAAILLQKNGYVFSQKIRGGHKELKDYVLDEKGYRPIGKHDKIKSRLYPRTLNVIDIHGKTKETRIDEKQVIFYSADHAKRAKTQREAAIQKAHELVKNPAKYNRATAYGAAKYVKGLEFDPETGEVATTKTHLIFDIEKLREEEKWDGYCAIISSELTKSDEEIMGIYKGLWKIEESFKVTKSDLETRPVYVSTKDHIAAHFLICFIALTLLRILENQLDNEFSSSKIAESLSKTIGYPLQENWYHFAHADEVTKAIEKKMGIPLSNKFLMTGEIRKILGATKKLLEEPETT